MGDLKAKFRAKLLRRASTQTNSPQSSPTSSPRSTPRKAKASSTPRLGSRDTSTRGSASVGDRQSQDNDDHAPLPPSPSVVAPLRRATESINSGEAQTLQNSVQTLPSPLPDEKNNKGPELWLEHPTPDQDEQVTQPSKETISVESPLELDQHTELPPSSRFAPREDRAEAGVQRKQSLVDRSNAHIIQTLLQDDSTPVAERHEEQEQHGLGPSTAAVHPGMLHRKIWVKRTGASPTLVQVREDDLVDDMREMILKKYGNSLGRSYDAPDITLKIIQRADPGHKHLERTLGPEEEICRTLDRVFPGGQTVEEALVIDIPQRRTPKPSPRANYQNYTPYLEDAMRPHESAGDYFPPMPAGIPSPAAMTNVSHNSVVSSHNHTEHSRSAISVLSTGQVPALPSPGGTRRAYQNRSNRPAYIRQHTSSPTALTSSGAVVPSSKSSRPRLDSSASEHLRHSGMLPPGGQPPLATPPIQALDGGVGAGGAVQPPSNLANTSLPTTPPVSSPGPGRERRNKNKKRQSIQTAKSSSQVPATSVPTSLGLDTSVPPINVLIVEDNHINLKLLEQFIRRLKVRWATAVNGREAVNKWRAGGFHLVLMDIQLPIMSGLEATKEIRRLERVNGIGVFSGGESSSASAEAPKLGEPVNGEIPEDAVGSAKEDDKLDLDQAGLFKSPVIIVALTASNLQVDRHEALAAGCNDFLTKPVNFVWFERKVKEWGCMQALIDFDGWRKWKDFAATSNDAKANGAPKKAATTKKIAALKAVESVGSDATPDNSS